MGDDLADASQPPREGAPPAGAPARYARQVRFAPLGPEGQARLGAARVALIGVGALGAAIADMLVRAGIGTLRLIDRDFVELDNLQRQSLYDEDDVAAGLPKAAAAAAKLRRINSTVQIEPIVADAHAGNALELCAGADLLLDGTDNLETRYLLNDVAVKLGRPWVYAACVAAEGRVLAVRPRVSPCLRCVWPELPGPGSVETCETVGVLAGIVHVVAGVAVVEALKLLAGQDAAVTPGVLAVDLWEGRWRTLAVGPEPAPDCPCCGAGRYEFLEGERRGATETLCGRNAVQVRPASVGHPASPAQLDLRALAAAFDPALRPWCNDYLLRFQVETLTVTLFLDGRAIVQGTSDAATARRVYARYIGG